MKKGIKYVIICIVLLLIIVASLAGTSIIQLFSDYQMRAKLKKSESSMQEYGVSIFADEYIFTLEKALWDDENHLLSYLITVEKNGEKPEASMLADHSINSLGEGNRFHLMMKVDSYGHEQYGFYEGNILYLYGTFDYTIRREESEEDKIYLIDDEATDPEEDWFSNSMFFQLKL